MSEPATFRSMGGGQKVARSAPALRGLAIPILLVAAWQLASHGGLVDARLLPPLEMVLGQGLRELVEGRLLIDLGASLGRDLLGLAAGATLGLALGTALGVSRLADRLLSPSFDGLKQIAIFAWIPLISMWFGMGEVAKLVFIALAAFTPMVVNTAEGVRSASRHLLEVGQTLTFTPAQKITRIYLPAAAPSIATGLHLAMIYAWLATVGAEYFMTVGPGIGGLIIEGRERFEMALVLLGIVILGAVGLALSRIATLIEHRLLRWRSA